MPKWLQGVFLPTLMLWLYVIAIGIAAGLAPDGGTLSSKVDYLSRIAFSFILASWLIADARKRRQRLCYDYDTFAFFAWPVVLPVYLFRTRGMRAFLTTALFRRHLAGCAACGPGDIHGSRADA
jgi:hypothetical protein